MAAYAAPSDNMAFAPPENTRLAELMKSFGCADVIAPVDWAALGSRVGELIGRAASAPKAVVQREDSTMPTKRAETDRISLLDVLENAPRSERHAMLAAVVASASLLITAGAAALLG